MLRISLIREALGRHVWRGLILLALPLLPLAGFRLGGEPWLAVTAIGAAGLGALVLWLPRGRRALPGADRGVTDNAPLPLRRALLAEIAAQDSVAQLARLQAAVLVVALDRCPALDDRIGQAARDEILNHIGRRLRSMLRAGDYIARLDGCAFGVALSPEPRMSHDTLTALARRIQSALADPVRVNDSPVRPTVSVGLCSGHVLGPAPHGDRDRTSGARAKALLENAETAAEAALAAGPGGLCAYVPGMQGTAARRRARAQELARALEDGAIIAHFQPQVATGSGAVTGMEALVRWQREGRMAPPDTFLPDLHDLGLSERLMQRMLAQALDALAQLDAQGLHVPGVAINLSEPELRLPGLADTVLWELDRRGIAPERLVIEVLETVVAGPADCGIARTIARLARAGCGIDLDDFGTGHASIANIRHFAVNRLKIDRSFVTGVDHDAGQHRLVSAIVSMAQELDLRTLAEGVETDAQAEALAALGCDALQGYAIGRPMPLDALTDWLCARSAAPTDAAPTDATAEEPGARPGADPEADPDAARATAARAGTHRPPRSGDIRVIGVLSDQRPAKGIQALPRSRR
ncbi:MAG: EAL domain-containing protein [Rhodobacteraceae bacterium]|nr:EAL domain-containing protein [Paracoccaceae bacterium]